MTFCPSVNEWPMKLRMKTSDEEPASTSQTTLSPMEKPSIRLSRLSTPEEILVFGNALPFMEDLTRKWIAEPDERYSCFFPLFCQGIFREEDEHRRRWSGIKGKKNLPPQERRGRDVSALPIRAG